VARQNAAADTTPKNGIPAKIAILIKDKKWNA
jgi:hypothetical protein